MEGASCLPNIAATSGSHQQQLHSQSPDAFWLVVFHHPRTHRLLLQTTTAHKSTNLPVVDKDFSFLSQQLFANIPTMPLPCLYFHCVSSVGCFPSLRLGFLRRSWPPTNTLIWSRAPRLACLPEHRHSHRYQVANRICLTSWKGSAGDF